MRETAPVNREDIEMALTAQAECNRLGFNVTPNPDCSFIVTTNAGPQYSCNVEIHSSRVVIRPFSKSSQEFAKRLRDTFAGLNFTHVNISNFTPKQATASPGLW